MAERLLKPNEEAIAEAVGQRLTWALQIAGLSIGQAASKLHQPRGLVLRWAGGGQLPGGPHLILDLAELCCVDARWLARGQIRDVPGDLRELNDQALAPLPKAEREKVDQFLERLPVAALDSGTCRYCRCTDFAACVDATLKACHWVDDLATICSACLEPQE